jgi:hypothetical protein
MMNDVHHHRFRTGIIATTIVWAIGVLNIATAPAADSVDCVVVRA